MASLTPGSDLPPAYYSLKEEDKTAPNATEVTIPCSHDVPEIYWNSFEDKDSRISFIQKVITIKLLQVLAGTAMMASFVASTDAIWDAMTYGSTRINLIVVATLAFLATQGLIHYCNEARFVAPFNFMFLVAYPLTTFFFVSVVSWGWGLDEILISWVHFNIVMCVLLLYSVFALQTKIEFKTSIGLSITAGTLIVAYALTVPFFYEISTFGILYCSLMMFLLTAYMLNDLQAMMTKTYRIHLTPDDFVKAAVIMHIDYRYMIMNLYKKHAQPHFRREVEPPLNAA